MSEIDPVNFADEATALDDRARTDALANSRDIQCICHKGTGTSLFRVPAVGQRAAMREAARDQCYPDSIMISRGSGMPAYGKLVGSPFKIAASRTTRVSFFPAGADSEITYSPTSETFGINFPQNYLKSLISEGDSSFDFGPVLFQADEQLIQLSLAAEAEIESPGFASTLLIEGISRALAVRLLRIDPHSFISDADRIHLPAWKLRRVVDYIDVNLGADIRLSDLANIAGLSAFHFGRVFKRATGISPYHFVRQRRIERSCALLIDDKLDIAQLALSCGFSSQSHFTAAFTKSIGTSPARYRRQKRALPESS
ncbi:MAG: hypothetical protein C0476_01005 [Sphingomonas sp.]|nr:hypothetical protein [Sphingomonas sp.]